MATFMIDMHREPQDDDISQAGFRDRIKRDSRKIAGALDGLWSNSKELLDNLSLIRQSLDHIALAQMKQADIMAVYWDDKHQLQAVPSLTDKDEVMAKNIKEPRAYVDGIVKPHVGTGGPLGWVFHAPAPFSGVVIVCSPDDDEPAGIRCHAEVALPGGERKRYELIWNERE